jgi:hypothetical protein
MFGTESAFTCQTYGVNKFIIIDDESHRFPPGCENLVSTNYSEGMTDQTVASVIMKYCQYLT